MRFGPANHSCAYQVDIRDQQLWIDRDRLMLMNRVTIPNIVYDISGKTLKVY